MSQPQHKNLPKEYSSNTISTQVKKNCKEEAKAAGFENYLSSLGEEIHFGQQAEHQFKQGIRDCHQFSEESGINCDAAFVFQKDLKIDQVFEDLKGQHQMNKQANKREDFEKETKTAKYPKNIQVNYGKQESENQITFHHLIKNKYHSSVKVAKQPNLKLQQVLYSSILMGDEEICERCQDKCFFYYDGLQISKRLFEKYASSQNYYYTRDINEILVGGQAKVVIDFKDKLIEDEESEYLKRFYFFEECRKKGKLLSEYYKFHKDIPRLFMLPLTLMLNSYHNKKRRYEYYRIAKIIEDENKLNPERPPKEIAGNKVPIKTNETISNQIEDEKKKKKEKIPKGENDEDEQFFLEHDIFLHEISSFINRGNNHHHFQLRDGSQSNNQKQAQNLFPKQEKKKEEQRTVLKELHSKLEEIVTEQSITSLCKSIMQEDGKQSDKLELDNFLRFLHKRESINYLADFTMSNSSNQKFSAKIENNKPHIVGLSSSQVSNQNGQYFDTPRCRTTLGPSQGLPIRNKQQKLNEGKLQSQPAQYDYPQKVVPSQNQEKPQDKIIHKQSLPTSEIKNASSLSKKKPALQLRIDDIDSFAQPAVRSSTTITEAPQINFHTISGSMKSSQRLQIGNQNPLSFRSARDQYPSTTTAQGNPSQSSKEIKQKITTDQQPYLSHCLKHQFPLSQSKYQQQSSNMQQTNSAISNSLVAKVDTKESQLITPRSPHINNQTSSVINSKILNLQTLVNKPPISLSPKQSIYTVNNYINQNPIEIEDFHKNSHLISQKVSSNLNKNSQPTSQAQRSSQQTQPLSKSGWKHLNLKLKLDYLNTSKEKPQNTNNSNQNGIINNSSNINIIASNGQGSKEQLSHRTSSSKNIDQFSSKYNFYEIFKQQIVNSQGNAIASSIKSNVNTPSQSNLPQAQAAAQNVMQLIQAQQNLFKNSTQTELASPKQGQNNKKESLPNNQPTGISSPQQQKIQTLIKPQISVLPSSSPSYPLNSLKQELLTQEPKKQQHFIYKKSINPAVGSIGHSLSNNSQKFSTQKKAFNTKIQKNESAILKHSQIKITLEKSLSAHPIEKGEQVTSGGGVGVAGSGQSKQVSRNSSLETNQNVLGKKTPQLFKYPQKEIKSVYNLVQQLATDGIQTKQTVSARNYKTGVSSPQAPHFEFPDSQISSHPFNVSIYSSPSQYNPSQFQTNKPNNINMALSGYHQSKVSQQLSELENRDSAPSTTSGKSNNTSTQQYSTSGPNSAANFKNYSVINGSTFSTFNASSYNINPNNPQILLSYPQIAGKTVAQSKLPTASITNQFSQQPTTSTNIPSNVYVSLQTSCNNGTNKHSNKEGSPQVIKKPSIAHKHTKSENSSNTQLEGLSGGINGLQSASPLFNIQTQNLQYAETSSPSSSDFLQTLQVSKKNNEKSSTLPTSPTAISSSIHTHPISPRLQVNNFSLQGKLSDRQKSSLLSSNLMNKKQNSLQNSKDLYKSNSLQVQILQPSGTQTKQSITNSSIQSPNNGSLLGISKKMNGGLVQANSCFQFNSTQNGYLLDGNQSNSSSNYHSQGLQFNIAQSNKPNSGSVQNTSGGPTQNNCDQLKKAKKKSMW